MVRYFIIDVGDDAYDQPTLGSAKDAARASVIEGGFSGVTVYPASSGGDESKPVFAVWEVPHARGGPPLSVLETTDSLLARQVYRRHTQIPRMPPAQLPSDLRTLLGEARRLHDNDFYEEAADLLDVAADALEQRGFLYEAAAARSEALRLRVYLWVDAQLPHLRGGFATEDVRGFQRAHGWSFRVVTDHQTGEHVYVMIARSKRPYFVRSHLVVRELETARRFRRMMAEKGLPVRDARRYRCSAG